VEPFFKQGGRPSKKGIREAIEQDWGWPSNYSLVINRGVERGVGGKEGYLETGSLQVGTHKGTNVRTLHKPDPERVVGDKMESPERGKAHPTLENFKFQITKKNHAVEQILSSRKGDSVANAESV